MNWGKRTAFAKSVLGVTSITSTLPMMKSYWGAIKSYQALSASFLSVSTTAPKYTAIMAIMAEVQTNSLELPVWGALPTVKR